MPTEDNQEGHIEETEEQEVEEPPNVPLEEEFPELMDEVEGLSFLLVYFNCARYRFPQLFCNYIFQLALDYYLFSFPLDRTPTWFG